jgi:tetratricopeptide (TPR) repeat protein
MHLSRTSRWTLHVAARALLVTVLAGTLSGCGGGLRAPNPHTTPTPDDPEALAAAIAAARVELAAAPDEPYWAFRLGELQVAADSTEAAERSLLEALWIDPYHPPALALVSKLYFRQGRHEDAIARLEVARSEPSAFPDGFPDALVAGLAVHYDAIGELETADQLVSSIEEPRGGATASAVTYVKLRGDAFDTAGELAEHALERAPGSAANLNNYGITRLQAGDPQAAKAAFTEAIAIDPTLPGPYYNLAIVERFYFLDGEAARDWFVRYWALSRDDPDALADVLLAEAPSEEE